VIDRITRVWREAGFCGVWFGALARINVYRRLELVELDLTTLPALAETPFPLDFGFMSHQDTDEARLRFARGDRCFAAWSGDEIVSTRWIAEGRGYVVYLDRWVALESNDVYLYETHTQPEHRGHGVSAAAGTRLAADLAAEGKHRILAAVLSENRAGRRAYEKAGYRRTGTIGYVRLGPWRRDFGPA
jgi:RimJ/RimL family protein N-acetyltransferase